MKQITAYKLTNGTIVENHEQAELIQSRINFEDSIIAMVDTDISYSDYQDEIKSFILGNATGLKTIFDKLRIV